MRFNAIQKWKKNKDKKLDHIDLIVDLHPRFQLTSWSSLDSDNAKTANLEDAWFLVASETEKAHKELENSTFEGFSQITTKGFNYSQNTTQAVNFEFL